ncbi:MAG: hypothetical protein FJ225_03705 [Lentisphaerae bacterium]|nr:hypothetical protein [Lentisphaerota bacterium]
MTTKKKGRDTLTRATTGAAGLLILLAILIAANVVLRNLRLRADLTEQKLYTLSEGTRNILRGLDRDVTLKLFFNSSSPEAPVALKSYARQVEDLLREYRLRSGGRITVETFDPKPDSDAEEWAQRYGIQGWQLGMLSAPLMLGLVAVSGGAEAVIPALDPRLETLLEYHVTRLIYRVAHPEKPVVGVISSLPVLGARGPMYPMPGQPPGGAPPWIAFRNLREDYDLRAIDPAAAEIAPDVQALIVIHPKDPSPETLFAIDQFVLRGGHLMAFLDPASLVETELSGVSPLAGRGAGSNLGRLLETWGVGYDASKVLADLRAVSRVRGPQNRVEESPVWLSLRAANVNAGDLLTSQLESLLMPYAGVFSDRTSSDLEFTPLITSSDSIGVVSAMTAQFGSEAIRRDFKPEPTPAHVAVKLSGKFTTAFPDGKPGKTGPPSEAEGSGQDEAGTSPPALTEGRSMVILVGDADMLYDRFCVQQMDFLGFAAYQPMNNNLDFLDNAVELASGSSDLIAIRSRGKFTRPFDRVLALESAARREWQSREDDLSDKLREAQRQLRELQTEKDSSQRFILSARQKEAVERFREEELRIKQELKEVRKNLRRDIERLGVAVKVINIGLMPLAVSLAGVGYALLRRKAK